MIFSACKNKSSVSLGDHLGCKSVRHMRATFANTETTWSKERNGWGWEGFGKPRRVSRGSVAWAQNMWQSAIGGRCCALKSVDTGERASLLMMLERRHRFQPHQRTFLHFARRTSVTALGCVVRLSSSSFVIERELELLFCCKDHFAIEQR